MMTDTNKPIWAEVKDWWPLTERPPGEEGTHPPRDASPAPPAVPDKPSPQATPPARAGSSPALTKLLYDVVVYPHSSITLRVKRLGVSARAFEKAKLEGCEKGLFFESSAGATIYLVPQPQAFEALGFPCPYKRAASIEHGFFVSWGAFLLEKDPAVKKVYTELKLGDFSCTSDIVTVRHDGTRTAWEVTLSTTNLLSNATKYARTDFAQIVFLCRDYKLREAVKACCREGGLDPDLLARLDYMQFSTLLRRQRKMSLY